MTHGTYHKIHGLYKRDEKGRFTSEFAKPEFEYLYHQAWNWTEKVDGTNIRIGLNGGEPDIRGKTDKAQLPPLLAENIGALLTKPPMSQWREKLGGVVTTLYGEGYGAGIQKGGGRYRPDKGFILFDVRRGERWLDHEEVEEVAVVLGLEVVPMRVWMTSIADVIPQLAHGGCSTVAKDPDTPIEGLVGIPAVPLFNQWGERVIVKLKLKDHVEATDAQ